MENQLVQKVVSLNLLKVDGNAFSIMGAFRRQAKKENWTDTEIQLVLDEATKSDYNYLLSTILNYCDFNCQV